MNKKTLSERVSKIERDMARYKREIGSLRSELEDRTRPANRIGFEVHQESDWDIGDDAGGSREQH